MTRADFSILATNIASLENIAKRKMHCEFLAGVFARIHPRFDAVKWYKACNVPRDFDF